MSMKLAIFGSRSLFDERVKIIILEEIDKHKPDSIVTSAEPEGVCKMARDIAKEVAIPLKLHFLNFKYLRGAFEHRSKGVYKDCDHVVLIHDGESKGTTNELRLAKKMNIANTYYILEKTEFKASVGFEITDDWETEETEWSENGIKTEENAF